MKEHDQAQEFYEHIARNYTEIRSKCLKAVWKMRKDPEVWDKENKSWFPEVDQWDAFDAQTDINYYTDGNQMDYPSDQKPTMSVTAYLYDGENIITETYVKIDLSK